MRARAETRSCNPHRLGFASEQYFSRSQLVATEMASFQSRKGVRASFGAAFGYDFGAGRQVSWMLIFTSTWVKPGSK
jgi:hypothetical protein